MRHVPIPICVQLREVDARAHAKQDFQLARPKTPILVLLTRTHMHNTISCKHGDLAQASEQRTWSKCDIVAVAAVSGS